MFRRVAVKTQFISERKMRFREIRARAADFHEIREMHFFVRLGKNVLFRSALSNFNLYRCCCRCCRPGNECACAENIDFIIHHVPCSYAFLILSLSVIICFIQYVNMHVCAVHTHISCEFTLSRTRIKIDISTQLFIVRTARCARGRERKRARCSI